MTSDPVCRMEVDENSASKSSYQGKDYYFCSAACQSQFQTNPESFRAGGISGTEESSRESEYVGERSESFKTEGQRSWQKTDEMAGQVKSMATDMKDKAKERTKSFLQSNKDYAAGRLEGTANAFRQAARNLEGETPVVSRYVNQIADKIEGASEYLREKEVKELIEDTERFVKSKPVLLFAAAVALGVIAARFLKSSRQESDHREAE